MTASAELATRPDNKLGTDEQWDMTEAALEQALKLNDIPYTIAEGEGAFYGPKIDLLHGRRPRAANGRWGRSSSTRRCRHASGSRTWGRTTRSTTLYVIHRALYGSFERFIGILIEHYAGAFPVWLAPVQVRIIPVGRGPPRGRAGAGREAGRVPRGGRRLGRDGRQADPQRRGREDPVRLVWGDKESEGAIAVREHGGEQSTKSLDELLAELRDAATV